MDIKILSADSTKEQPLEKLFRVGATVQCPCLHVWEIIEANSDLIELKRIKVNESKGSKLNQKYHDYGENVKLDLTDEDWVLESQLSFFEMRKDRGRSKKTFSFNRPLRFENGDVYVTM